MTNLNKQIIKEIKNDIKKIKDRIKYNFLFSFVLRKNKGIKSMISKPTG